MKTILLSIFIMLTTTALSAQEKDQMVGAWQTTTTDGNFGLLIVSENHFSMTFFTFDPAEFIGTRGGKWERSSPDSIHLTWEFNTFDKSKVGTSTTTEVQSSGDVLKGGEYTWSRLDNGGPGALAGAWVITGRKRGEELRTMTPGARKTMKILSGTRFQWIAYNSETGEFMGTGGGTYSTEDGKYTEHIQFFSRDNTRVGASLQFDYDLKDGEWEHSGLSSRGDPIFEIWSRRSKIGI